MLKREITYKNFNDEEVTDTFYFHIAKSEIIELQVEHEGGIDAMIRRIIETKDYKSLIAEFKRIILLAYGEKSDDGKRFIKSAELREAFSQTAAFDELFMELATSDTAAVDFIKGVVPAEMVEQLGQSLAPPSPPTTQPAENIQK